MKKLVLLVAALGVVAGLALHGSRVGWWLVERSIRADFPGVPTISTDSLAARLDGGAAPVLLDVRTEAEYAVGHLPGARRIDPAHPDLDALARLPRDTPLVAYCSVGYRSAALVDTLRAMGFEHAVNLRGSLFRWANEGRAVVREGRPVTQVHPYDRTWGLLLHRERRADVPAANGGN